MADDRGVIPLSRFTAALGRLRGKKRMEMILEQKDPAALVAEMPVQDLYFLIKEVGLADAGELIELATPEQFQGFLDLDVWDVDRLRDADARPWLAALLDAGFEKLGHVWAELDPELTALLLQRWTRIYNIVEEELPEWEDPPFYPTPDRFFMVKITADDPEVIHLVERLLDHLYRADAAQARHTLRAAMSEPPAEMEEMAYRWRAGRLQDLGYAAHDEALEVYQPVDPGAVKIGEGTSVWPDVPTTLPAVFAEPTLKTGFFGQVLARVNDVEESRRLEAAIVTLLNRALAADRVSPGDATAAAAGAARAAATISLGLEALARGDVERGLEALRTIALVRLHRLGYTITLQLKKLALALGARAERAEEPLASVAAGLREKRPVYARVLDDPPQPGTRPFTTMDDVRRAATAIARLAAETQLVFDVGGADPRALGHAVTLGDAGRTLLVHAALGHEPRVAPLTQEDVRAFLALPERDRRAAAEIALRERLGTPPQEFSAVIEGWMGDLTDLRRVESLIVERIR